jgi:hypothetical protein
MFQNTSTGYKILIAHILSVVIIALIYSLKTPQTQQISTIQKQNSTNILYESFSSSVMAVLIAGGFISFFYTTAAVVTDFNILYPLKICLTPIFGNDLSNAICYGIIEATGGCAQIAQINSTLSVASSLTIPTTGFLITFGGLSILLQQLCYLTSCGIKPSFFIATKFLQATLCFLTLFLLCL